MSYRGVLVVLLAFTLAVIVGVGSCEVPGRSASTPTPEPTPICGPTEYCPTPAEGTPVRIEALPVPVYPGARLVSEGWDDPIEFRRDYVVANATKDEVLRFYYMEAPSYRWSHRPMTPEAAPGSQTPNYDVYDLYDYASKRLYRLHITVWTRETETVIVLIVRYEPEM